MMTAAFGPLRDLRFIDGDEDPNAQVLLGIVDVFSVPHHVTFVRVCEDERGEQRPICDPHRRYEWIAMNCENGPPIPVAVAGHEGMWVCGIDPFED